MALTTHIHTAAATLAAATLVGVAAGCGGGAGGGAQSASGFIGEVTTQFSRGQTGRLWDTLHPADQAVVPRVRYMACESTTGFELRKLKILETYADTVDVAGTAMPATAVSVRASTDDGVTTATMHAVTVNGKWRWILPAADLAAYKRGACPSS